MICDNEILDYSTWVVTRSFKGQNIATTEIQSKFNHVGELERETFEYTAEVGA